MNNLFVCHSQAQLILAVGLAKGRFANEKNHLILFTDFAIKESMKLTLSNVFERVLFRVGTYPAINKSWKAKIERYPNDIKAINAFISRPYDKVFEVCDGSIPEIYILKRASKLNGNVEMIWLEDASYPYYVNSTETDGLNSNDWGRNARKIIFKYLFGLGKFYDFEGNYMSGNKNLTKAYLTLKGFERDIFRSKEVVGISDEEYKQGIKILFDASNVDVEKDSIILVLDKLDIYHDINAIRQLVNTLAKVAADKGIKLYYKFHPREEGAMEELGRCMALDKNLGIECYYAALMESNVVIVGVKSTGLQSAKLLGFKTISAAAIVGEADEVVMDFYGKIGVFTPLTFTELVDLL